MHFFRSLSALILLSIIVHGRATAQNTIYLSEGKIEFEKKINRYARMDEDNSWTELEKKAMPQSKTTYFDLLFTRSKSLYKPGRENTDNNKIWEQPAEENVVYSDLDNGRSVRQKKVFEQLFLGQKTPPRNKRQKTTNTPPISPSHTPRPQPS